MVEANGNLLIRLAAESPVDQRVAIEAAVG
jgi:hypothetical protein